MQRKPLVAVYPGTFDPITNGHLDIIQRALQVSDRLILAIAKNPKKGPLFNLKERTDMVQSLVADLPQVEVHSYAGLTVDFARQMGATILIRGLRAISDFEYELQMAQANRKLAPSIDTVFLMPSQEYFYLNSTLVRNIAADKGDVSSFVPPIVEKKLREKFGR